MVKRLFFASVALLSFGCASAHSLQPAQVGARPPPDRHVYRLDFVVAANDSGKAPQSSAYTLNLEEYDSGELRVGSNLPIGTGPSPRQDVGLKIRANLSMVGDDLVLRSDVEMSGTDDASSIHKVSANGDAVLRGGKPSLVASLEDPLSHKHYEVTATATMLH